MKNNPKINEFTEPELQIFRDQCNFSDEELEYFNLKAKKKSIIEISQIMHISDSKVSKLARKVKDKMIRII